MTAYGRLLVLLAAAVVIAVIALVLRSGAAAPSGALTLGEAGMVDAWLVCYECDTELDSLKAVGARKPAATVDTLGLRLARGPQPSLLRDSAFAKFYRVDAAYRVRHGLPVNVLSPDQYVAQESAAFAAAVKVRAAIGLGYIHTPAAVSALQDALTHAPPASLAKTIHFALDSLPP